MEKKITRDCLMFDVARWVVGVKRQYPVESFILEAIAYERL